MTVCTTDTLVRPSVFAELMEALPETAGRWELTVSIPFKEGTVFGKAILNSVNPNGLFSERTKLQIVIEDRLSPGVATDVEGEMSAHEARFDVHIIDPVGKVPPMTCILQASRQGEVYEGTWSAPCGSPETCGCGGTGDSVRLEKHEPDNPVSN